MRTGHIEVTRAWHGGIVYRVVGGPENGRTLTAEMYSRMVEKGTPVIRR